MGTVGHVSPREVQTMKDCVHSGTGMRKRSLYISYGLVFAVPDTLPHSLML